MSLSCAGQVAVSRKQATQRVPMTRKEAISRNSSRIHAQFGAAVVPNVLDPTSKKWGRPTKLLNGCDRSVVCRLFRTKIHQALKRQGQSVRCPLNEAGQTSLEYLFDGPPSVGDSVIECVQECLHAKINRVTPREFRLQLKLLEKAISRLQKFLTNVRDRRPIRSDNACRPLVDLLEGGLSRELHLLRCSGSAGCKTSAVSGKSSPISLLPPWHQIRSAFLNDDPWFPSDDVDLSEEDKWDATYDPSILLAKLKKYKSLPAHDPKRHRTEKELKKILLKYEGLVNGLLDEISTQGDPKEPELRFVISLAGVWLGQGLRLDSHGWMDERRSGLFADFVRAAAKIYPFPNILESAICPCRKNDICLGSLEGQIKAVQQKLAKNG